jgi:hypothetical protein
MPPTNDKPDTETPRPRGLIERVREAIEEAREAGNLRPRGS